MRKQFFNFAYTHTSRQKLGPASAEVIALLSVMGLQLERSLGSAPMHMQCDGPKKIGELAKYLETSEFQ